eukprot:PITA_26816
MYLVNTKPDICYAVNTLSQLMVEPKRAHWAAKHILRLGKKFGRVTLGFLEAYGKRPGGVRFSPKRHASDTRSAVRSALRRFGSDASVQRFQISRKRLKMPKRRFRPSFLGASVRDALRGLEPGGGASCNTGIKLSENPVFHDRSKHIDICCHFIKDCVQCGAVQLEYTPTRNQVADVFTKALGRTKFVQFREQMGMLENPFQ